MRHEVKHPKQHFGILQRRRLLQKNQAVDHRKIRCSKPRAPALHLPVQAPTTPPESPPAVASRCAARRAHGRSKCASSRRLKVPTRIRGSDALSRRRFVLRLPAQRVVVAPVAEVQKATRRHQKVKRGIQLLAHRSPQRTRVRPVMQLVHRRNQRQPVRHVAVAQSARALLLNSAPGDRASFHVCRAARASPRPAPAAAPSIRASPAWESLCRAVAGTNRDRPPDSGSREGKW